MWGFGWALHRNEVNLRFFMIGTTEDIYTNKVTKMGVGNVEASRT